MMPCPVCWGARTSCHHCQGRGEVEDVRFGRYFRLSEFLRSDTAREKGIPNAPTAVHVHRIMVSVVHLLQPLRRIVGPLRITSGFRSEALNRAVGGSTTSAHLTGWAADVVPVQVPPVRLMEILASGTYGIDWDQAILYPGHIHLGYARPSTLEQRFELREAREGAFPLWRPEAVA